MNPNKAIHSIMQTNLVTVSPEATAAEIQAIFDKYDFHHLPVVEKGRRLAGIISRNDVHGLYLNLLRLTSGKTWTEKEFARLTARNIMTLYPLQLEPDDTIGLAADIFLANKFHALPVVEDGQLVGLVTTHDLLKYGFAEAVGV